MVAEVLDACNLKSHQKQENGHKIHETRLASKLHAEQEDDREDNHEPINDSQSIRYRKVLFDKIDPAPPKESETVCKSHERVIQEEIAG